MRRFAWLLLAAWPAPWLAAAERPDHPIVPGFERFHPPLTPPIMGGDKGGADSRGGQLLLGELNCVSCHQPADAALARKQAPILDSVATRVRLGYLRKFLADPQVVKPGSTMPALFAGDPERAAKVEALVHFLASTGSLRQERPDRRVVASGRDLYHKVGCVACHGTRDAAGNPDKVLPTSVPLGDVKAKYSLASLAAFLANPHQVRPSGRMPRLLSGKEPQAVANYLLQGIKVDLASGKGATAFAYYEGSWDRVPDFERLKPAAIGTAPGFDLSVARRGSNFAMKFEGFLKVEREGNYTFILTSDDGSRLSVDGKTVVNNDGVHPPSTAQGAVKLTKGTHKVAVGFFQVGGGAELAVDVEAPGFGRHNLGDLVAATEAALERKPPKKTSDEDSLEIQPALVAKGKSLFASAGCASCHQLNDGKKAIASTLSAAPLARLKAEGGCLSAAVARGLPWFSLSAAQRGALAAAIKNPPPAAATPAAVIARTLTTFNCYACHSRDKVGGPEEELNKLFQTTQPEMGDEGRVPPPLDGVGAKLNPDYLRQLLDKGAHDRPYMHTRMPGFGSANVGPLVEAFAAIDKLPAVPAVTFAEPLGRVKSKARHLVGGQAFGCIKCHTFNGIKAEGVQGIDMTLMPRRVRHDWFHAYVADPQRLRPGTRMPAAFVNGKSVLPDILDGKASTQIEAMWLYLQDGAKARPPAGLGSHSIPLEPIAGAIIYRNFIEGAGTRAIAVGYPEKVHLAFDANDMRLSLLWQGAFIDAGRHWTDRGAGFEGPLGDNVLHLHGGAAFAVLHRPDEAWPAAAAKTLGYKFRGYRLTPDDRPTFLYSLGDIRFEDTPNPAAGKPGTMGRRLAVTAAKPVDGLCYRAAAGGKIEALGDGWYRIDGAWKLKVESKGPPRVRQSAGKAELLVPVHFTNGKAVIVQEYAW